MKARVIGSLKSGFIDVLAGYNLGQLNGGTVQRIAVEHFPLDCRMPNTYIIITYDKSFEILKIELDHNANN